jgi:hypothetical protein
LLGGSHVAFLVLRIADALGHKQASTQKDNYLGGAGIYCLTLLTGKKLAPS